MSTSEGILTLNLSKDELWDTLYSQQQGREEGILGLDDYTLEIKLANVATQILGFFIGGPVGTAYKVARSFVFLGTKLTASEKDRVAYMSIRGENWLNDQYQTMKSNGYTSVSMRVPHLTYQGVGPNGEDVVIISGYGIVDSFN